MVKVEAVEIEVTEVEAVEAEAFGSAQRHLRGLHHSMHQLSRPLFSLLSTQLPNTMDSHHVKQNLPLPRPLLT